MNRLIITLCLFAFISCKKESTKVESVSDVPQSNEVLEIDPSINVNFITGRFQPSEDSTFIKIPTQYADREGLYMKKEAFNSFLLMYEHAQKDGIKLIIRSAARDFNYQKGIWERKWTGQTILSSGENAATDFNNDSIRATKILEYSSMPGTSRHHWGTDIDLNNFNNSWFESGEGLKLFNWLEENAHNYGFCRPYTKKGSRRPFGYNEEKWHWSYTPLSDKYTSFAKENLNNKDIEGFMGSHVSSNIDVVEKYVLGINQNCK